MLKGGICNGQPRRQLRSTRLPRMVVGIGLIAMSVLALAAPLAAGTWSLQFLSLFPFVVGLTELYATARDPALRTRPASYFSGFLAVAAAIPLFLSPANSLRLLAPIEAGCLSRSHRVPAKRSSPNAFRVLSSSRLTCP